MGTFKLQLTEEQWAAAMPLPAALAAALFEQQPDLYARLEAGSEAKFQASLENEIETDLENDDADESEDLLADHDDDEAAE